MRVGAASGAGGLFTYADDMPDDYRCFVRAKIITLCCNSVCVAYFCDVLYL